MNKDSYLIYTEEEMISPEEQNLIQNPNLITDLVNKKIQFVSIIESLKSVVTDQNVANRGRGINFLSWILTEIPPDLFHAQEITAITNFYCDRLQDGALVTPAAIKGHLALVKMKNIQKESICQILNSIFQEIHHLPSSSRGNIYAIMAHVVENHLNVASSMGSDFVLSIISLADGEIDPSNLRLLFQFLPVILKNVELGHLMEDAFDLLSCYFPIDYNSNPEKISITRDELAFGLANCLIAQPGFSDHCLPMIVDKLNSSLKVAKVDSYKLLGGCCETYPPESINKHSKELWKVIQNDIFLNYDIEIKEAALNALSEIVRLFSSSECESGTLENFLNSIIYGLKTLLKSIEDNLFCPGMKILESVSYKSVVAAQFVISDLKFFFNFDAINTPNQKKIALSTLKPFLPIMKACNVTQSNKPELISLFTEISQFYIDSSLSKDFEIRKLAFSGLQDLVSEFNKTLRDKILEIGAKKFKNGEGDEVESEFRKIFRQLAKTAPDEFLKFLEMNSGQDSVGLTELNLFPFSISAVADIQPLTEYAILNLMNIITNSTNFDIGLSSLLNACKNAEERTSFLKTIHKDYMLTERLIKWWTEETSENRGKYETSIKYLSEIIALIVRSQETFVQKSIVDRFLPVLVAKSDISEDNIFLIEAIIGSVERNLTLEQFSSLHIKLVSLALTSEDKKIRISSSRLLATIANKASDDPPEWLMKTCESIFSSLNNSTPISERLNGTCLLNWIVKGLLLANSLLLEPLIFKWFDLLEKEDVGFTVIDGFRMILKEEDLYLNMESHCNIKILYRQRFFNYFPTLVKKFESARENSKINYLTPLISMVEGVPKYVSVTEISNVVKILAQALDVGIPNVLLVSLSILNEYLKDKENIFGDYTSSFIPKLLKIARYEGYMKIRMHSLMCLYWYGFYPTAKILPVKNEVIISLEPCLDDKKRLVRNEAVRTRNRWFLVGSPGEEDVFL